MKQYFDKELITNPIHLYRAKESILHMLWEMDKWLDKYVKNGSVN